MRFLRLGPVCRGAFSRPTPYRRGVGTGSGATPYALDLSTVSGLGQADITLSDGSTISLDIYPTDLAATVETSGANGATQIMLANMEAFIKELEDKGMIDANESGLLKDLGQSGPPNGRN